MSLAPLYPLTNQFQGYGGENLVGGFLKVYFDGTDDIAETFADAAGEARNPFPIVLDSLGMAPVWVDSARVYRLEVYNRNGGLCYTRYPVVPISSTGSGSATSIVSTDGSIEVEETRIGSTAQYDLSVAKDSAENLEWAHCTEARIPTGNVFYPIGDSNSTMRSDPDGLILTGNGLYHVSLKMRATKSAAVPFYDKVKILVKTDDGTETSEQIEFSALIDGSLGLSQEFDISGDVRTGSADATRLFVTVEDTSVAGVSYEFVGMDIHRIFSGVPHIPGLNLVAGSNITLTKNNGNLTIASSGGGSVPIPGQGGGDRFLRANNNGAMSWTEGPVVYRVLAASPDASEIAQIVAEAAQLPEKGSSLVIGIYNSHDGSLALYRQSLLRLTGASTGMVGFTCCTPDYVGHTWVNGFETAVFYADADISQNYARYMSGLGTSARTWDPWADYT